MTTNDTDKSSQDAILVAVMGRTGTGKTRFINNATEASLEEGHYLESCTRPLLKSLRAENYVSVC